MLLTVVSATHLGYVRQMNQDSYFECRTGDQCLLGVADGMGGHPCGEIASQLVSNVFKTESDSIFKSTDITTGLIAALLNCQKALFLYTDSHPACRGMGTTLVCGLIRADTALFAHIGDSRAYLIHRQRLLFQTRDHTVVQRWIDEGRLAARALHFHPYRHVLERVIGGFETDSPRFDFSPVFRLSPGDSILLCSDGLYGMLPDSELLAIISQPGLPITEKKDRLLRTALESGGKDNITFILAEMG